MHHARRHWITTTPNSRAESQNASTTRNRLKTPHLRRRRGNIGPSLCRCPSLARFGRDHHRGPQPNRGQGEKQLNSEAVIPVLLSSLTTSPQICQSDELGYTVDIGPNWIHAWTDSDEPHPIYKLATDTATPLHRWSNKQLIYDAEGDPLPDELTERLSTLLWEIIEEAFKFSEKARDADGAAKEIASHESLQDFIKRRAEEVVPVADERKLLVQMSEVFGAYVGEPVWKQSLRFVWMEECCGGGEWFPQNLTGTSTTNMRQKMKCLSNRPFPRSFNEQQSRR